MKEIIIDVIQGLDHNDKKEEEIIRFIYFLIPGLFLDKEATA